MSQLLWVVIIGGAVAIALAIINLVQIIRRNRDGGHEVDGHSHPGRRL